MGWLVALPFLATLMVVNKRVNPRGGGGAAGGKGSRGSGAGGGGFKGRDVVAVVTMLLAFVTGCGFAFTFLGRWGAKAVLWVGSSIAGVTGDAGWERGLPIAITVFMVLVAVADIAYDRKADKGAQFAAMVMPTLLTLVVAGSMGATGGNTVDQVFTQMSSFVSQLGGA